MTVKLGIVMDPIADIHFEKDTSLALLLEAKKRGWQLFYMEQKDLYLEEQQAKASMCVLDVNDNPDDYYTLGDAKDIALADLDVVLMRKDPPFNMDFVYTTYLLELAEKSGVLVVNKPQSLRDANEKLFTAQFPECCPPALVTSDKDRLRVFFAKHQDIICKPLDGMGGASIFRVQKGDGNASVIFETLTKNDSQLMMAQKYIPEISQGDKRILMINGEPVSHVLARLPKDGEVRGNLAAGGRGEVRGLTDRDHWIAKQVGPVLREKGLLFVGLDVIGDYLTEINVTSPTCVREIDRGAGIDISAQLFDCIESKLAA